jgi:hypothetical protein
VTADPAKIAKKVEDVIASGAAVGYACKAYIDPANPYSGLSYVASEVVYHACGGIKSGLKVMMMHTGEREIHCYLVDASGKVIDPTAKQYPRKVDYTTAHHGSFMSTEPSKRAVALADAIGITI